MAAYVILDAKVQNATDYAEYVKAGSPSVPHMEANTSLGEARLRFLREIGSRIAWL